MIGLIQFFPEIRSAFTEKYDEIHGLLSKSDTSNQGNSTADSPDASPFIMKRTEEDSTLKKSTVAGALLPPATETEMQRRMIDAYPVEEDAPGDSGETKETKTESPSTAMTESERLTSSPMLLHEKGTGKSLSAEPPVLFIAPIQSPPDVGSSKSEHYFCFFDSMAMAQATLKRWEKETGETFAMKKEEDRYFIYYIASPEDAEATARRIEEKLGIKPGRRPVY